jgi:hypothetical protein
MSAGTFVADGEPHDERIPRLAETESDEYLLRRMDDGDECSRLRLRPDPLRGVGRDVPGACAVRGRDLRTLLRPQDKPDLGRRSDDLRGRGGDLVVDARSTDGLDECKAGMSQRELACGRAFLLPDEARHTEDDEQEEDRRSADHDQQVGVPQLLDEVDARRDQAGGSEQSQASGRQAHTGVRSRFLEAAHRRVQGRCAPQDEIGEPAGVVDQLVVVRPRQEGVVVGAVGCEQTDRAGNEEVERRAFGARLHGEADQRPQQEHIAERVGDRNELRQDGETGEVQVRRDQEDPREESEPDGQDERVDDGRTVTTVRISTPDEQHQPGEERRVDGEVDGIAGRGKADRAAEEVGVRVGVEVARDVQHLAEQDQAPRGHRPRTVQAHAGGDRDQRRHPDHVDDHCVALERRHEQVGGGQAGERDDVPRPQRAPARCKPLHERHAARSATACRSNEFARRPSTSISWSISASVLAAVSCTRKPTSLRGTSG